MNNTPQHHTVGGWFAIISLAGATLTNWLSTHSELLSAIASIMTALAAGVSIYFTLRRKKTQ